MPRGFSRYEFLALEATFFQVHHEQEESAEEPAAKKTKQKQIRIKGDRPEVEGTHRPNRNVNAMLSLFPEADIIASETNGPMSAEVLPIYRISPQRMTPCIYMIELDYLSRRTGQRKGTCLRDNTLGSRHRAEKKGKTNI